MALVTTFTFQEWPQADGTKWVHYIFLVNGQEIHKHRRLPGATDSQTFGAALQADAQADAAAQEVTRIIRAIDGGADSLAAVQGATVATQKQAAYGVLQHGMRQDRPDFLVKSQSLITYLSANYTAAQLATFLGVTAAQLSAVNQRYQNAFGIAAQLATDQTLTQDI